ncbi:MAG: hypothetical protein CMJ37_03665 [Phycisphaerae bacterium]|nr:hypothetical protein [Phycisphaerae bacterium]
MIVLFCILAGLSEGHPFDLAENRCFETSLADPTVRADWPAYITSETQNGSRLLRVQANSGAAAIRLDGPKGSPSGPATLRIQARVTNLGEDQITLVAIRGEFQISQILTTDGDHEVNLPIPAGSTAPSLWCKIARQHLGDDVTPRTPVPNPRLRLDLKSVQVWPRRELRILETECATVIPNQELVLTLDGIDPQGEALVVTEVLPSGEVVEETLTDVLPKLKIVRTFEGLGRYQLNVQQGDLEVRRDVCIVPPNPLKKTRIAFFDPPVSFGDLHRFPTTPPIGSLVSRPMNNAKRVVIEQDRTQVVDRSTLVANLELEPSLGFGPGFLNDEAFREAGQHLFSNPRHVVLAPKGAAAGPDAARWHTLSSLSRSSVLSEGKLPGSGVRQLFRQDGGLYIWVDQPEFPLVLPVTNASERRNADGHVEVSGLAAGNIEPGARNIFVGPLREPEVLVLRQVDFVQPVQLTRNQEVNAALRIPNPRDVIWQGKIQADRSGPVRLRLGKNTLELLPGQEVNLPVTVEWPGSFVKHGRHPVNIEIQESAGHTITATLEVEVSFPGLKVELVSDDRMVMMASQPLDTQITWWDQESKIKREERQRLVPNESVERVIPTKATHFDVVSGIRTIRYDLQGMRAGGR